MSTANYVVTCVGVREPRARGRRDAPHSDAASGQSLARPRAHGNAQGTAVGVICGSIRIASTAAAAAASATASASAFVLTAKTRNYVTGDPRVKPQLQPSGTATAARVASPLMQESPRRPESPLRSKGGDESPAIDSV